MLPLLLRALFGASSTSPAEARGTAAAGAGFGSGGGSLAGGPPCSPPPAAEMDGTDTAAGAGEEVCMVGLTDAWSSAAAGVRDDDGAGSASTTEVSGPSMLLECRKRRAVTSEHALASSCERSKHGDSLQP